MEHVVDFVQMQRFDDPLLVEILHAMRRSGGKKVSEKAWQALVCTVLSSLPMIPVLPWIPRCSKPEVGMSPPDEWRIVAYAMHADSRLNAKAAGKPLFYIPAVDSPACRMGRAEYDDMRAFPNISTTAKWMGILPAHICMDVILT